MISQAEETRADVRSLFSIVDIREFRLPSGRVYAVVGQNPEIGLISDTWFGGFETEQQFRTVLEFICERFEQGGFRLWLADLRFLNSGFQHSDAWLAEHVFPRVIAGGLTREAVVLPGYQGAPAEYDVFGSASSALKKITDGRVRGFDDIDAARAWLLGQ
ncbi:hypothetical protein [Nisaea sp.]|uniref:hypothetical protein n=1 Tax=Nisaea sp. TaxID=2024842 RepID=UPI003B529F68